jgi:predicted RNA binding protein YcfA (HicA-like mRNA interferase family)
MQGFPPGPVGAEGDIDRARYVCNITHMDSRAVIKALEADGWAHKRTTGSHWHFGHPAKPGLVTVPHPKRDIPVGTLKAIERQSGLKLSR